ncbi:MAG: S24 family peptidase [Desulfuromonadaceae bacterium]
MAGARLSKRETLSKSDMETADLLRNESAKARERLPYTTRDCRSSVEVFDDSMYPKLCRGDIAYLDDARRVYCDGVYAFHHQGRPHIKRIQLMMDGRYYFSADSDAGADGQYVQPREIDVAGRVVFAWQRMDAR